MIDGRGDDRGAPAAFGRWWPACCALVAYLPALLSSPGRMPADTKLGLYLDPVRLTTEATATFDPSLYAGWVPHQQIAYLWPSGPWYSAFEALSVPDWIAHRLWIGTLLFAAGTGVGWALRRLGFVPLAALTGALVYQLSPYVLPYVSRTSALLLPFAGLGWIVGATLLATRDPGRVPWRWPTLVALIVATVGAVNATALLMIVPAPVLMLVHARRAERTPWRRLGIVTALTTLGCTLVSLWWVAMLVVQRRHGPDVLAYSESLRAVSTSSTSVESLRGLGYWLFYVRDHVTAATSASIDHLDRPAVVLAGFLALLLPLVGLVAAADARARLGAWCVAIGVLVAVGVHPIDDSSPVVRLLTGDPDDGLALALRSSARAVPVVVFGLAIGAASFVDRAPWPSRLPRPGAPRRTAALVVVVLTLLATPSWWTAALVDPDLDRDQDPPAAWTDAVTAIDVDHSSPTGTGRILQLPGAEFGAFAWGVTVDQPLSSLAERPVVTRDLLPLGSPAAMDLVFALDDRAQAGVLEPASLGPVARWLGIDRIWLAGDLDVERYDTARPGVVLDALERAPGIDRLGAWGAPSLPGSTVVDEELLGDQRAAAPIEPVVVFEPSDAGRIVRVSTEQVVLAGSGDGFVDAAAAGVLDGSELVLSAVDDALDDEVARLVVTDSHRARAHHWRTSQDVNGATEPAGAPPADDDGDERLPVFDDATDREVTDADRTVAEQVGPVTASASGYGQPFAYLPERRAAMAVDGDLDTAWTVGEHADPRGERLVLGIDADTAVERITVRQPVDAPDDRSISAVRISVDGARPVDAILDERSSGGSGQTIELGRPATAELRIEIAEVTSGRPNGVGFAEVDLGLGPTVEWVRTPTALPAVTSDGRVDMVVTRLRSEATDRWRSDPEPALRRRVPLPAGVDGPIAGGAELSAQVRLDPRADGITLGTLLGDPVIASDHLLGAPARRGAAAVDGDPSTAWITPFRMPIGPSLTLIDATGTTDRIGVVQPTGPYSPVTRLSVTDATGTVTASVVEGEARFERDVDLDGATVTIADAEVRSTVDRRFGDVVALPAAISELDLGGTIRATPSGDTVVEVVCDDRWIMVDGRSVPISFGATVEELLAGRAVDATACGPIDPGVGRDADVRIEALGPPGFQVDRVVIGLGGSDARPATTARPTWSVPGGADPRTVRIDACPEGCWVVLGHGYNRAWSAEIDGTDLGPPRLVDGNANGWWIDPFDEPVTVDFAWTAQRPVTLGVMISAAVVGAMLVALAVDAGRRRRADAPTRTLAVDDPAARSTTRPVVVAAGYVVASALFVSPAAGVAALLATVVADAVSRFVLRGRPVGRVVALVAVVGLTVMAMAVTAVVALRSPAPDLSWPLRFEDWHRPTLLLLATLVAGLEAVPVGEASSGRIRGASEAAPTARP